MNSEQSVQVIGIDLGGTAIKLGRFAADGTCYESLTVPTPQPATPEAVLATLVEAIAQIRENVNSIRAIGLGTPGPVDGTGKIAKVAINLAGWQDVPLGWVLEEKTGLPVILANDANCAGLGEAWLGAGRRFQNLILLTLGTGVGGAIILNGELFVGHQGAAGELGLISINFDGPICNSGNRGSLEQYTSVQGIRRDTGLEPAELAKKAVTGDKKALEYWQQYGKLLGIGLANLIYVLTPEAIILGGGISAGADLFLPSLKAELEERVLLICREGLEILIAELGNQAGMIGAAKLAFQKFVKIEDQIE
ncbi:ROK family protein [Planktothrix mougeotii]|uniref:ROK family protein n=1 Tax=Planktothrix mougeotii LEGE 06226 TaxID=1828728 RepID=A0ABR9UAY5_9CYAN|nr:ROK family protein [Planktothrix mougeotii]MBE9143616.1 ROK family protein [Planktothrix mougeotii LEGE 06226]